DDPDLYELVTRLQIHKHTNYCYKSTQARTDQNCRFGFPKMESDHTYYDEIDQRMVYQRNTIDSHVNNYNPYLLKMTRAAMDIQINHGNRVLLYLAKYLSKVDSDVELTHGMEDIHQHYKGRIVGSIDAAYFLSGWNKHRSSRGCIFISTTFPGLDERRLLKPNLASLDEDSESILCRTHVHK
ncbi:hypothetical protein BDB01DRAFT_690116, partial [Pilobolus umbonatus]